MGQLAIPMMIGAAVGGGTKLLQGKGIGDILKGAAIGGAGGAVTGGIGGATSGATSGALSSQGASGLLGSSALGATQAATSLAPTIAEGALAANTMIPYSTEIGMANSFNALTGAPMATDASSFAPSMFNNAVSEGGMSAANSAMTAPSTWDTRLGDFKNFADEYGTVQNVTGAGNLAMKYADMNKPRQMQAQSGQISRGQAPTMEGLLALQQASYGLPQRKKIDFSLLG